MSTKITCDVVVEIRFSVKDQNDTIIYTGANPEVVEEILSAWVQDEMFKHRGKDESPANEQDLYTITIGVRLEDDAFGLEANTGNRNLTLGIVANVMARLEADSPAGPKIPIKHTSEKPNL